MKNKDRIMRDLAFVVGRWERDEITSRDAVLKAQEITEKGCEHCTYCKPEGCPSYTCTEGFAAFLEEEAT